MDFPEGGIYSVILDAYVTYVLMFMKLSLWQGQTTFWSLGSHLSYSHQDCMSCMQCLLQLKMV